MKQRDERGEDKSFNHKQEIRPYPYSGHELYISHTDLTKNGWDEKKETDDKSNHK